MNQQILLDEIKLAYASLAMRPLRGTTYKHDKPCDYGCPLTALCLYRGGIDRSNPKYLEQTAASIHEWACNEFSDRWVKGFLHGFHYGEGKASSHPLYREGYECGELVAQAILAYGEVC